MNLNIIISSRSSSSNSSNNSISHVDSIPYGEIYSSENSHDKENDLYPDIPQILFIPIPNLYSDL